MGRCWISQRGVGVSELWFDGRESEEETGMELNERWSGAS